MPSNRIKYHKFFLSAFLITALSLVIYFTFSKMPKYRNVILISIDALRADHLSCYGYKRLTTPNIDKLAKEGTLFLQAVAPSTDTFHSFSAIMTSAYTHHYGENRYESLIDPSTQTLAEILSKHGYSTSLFSNSYPVSMIHGINRGFKTFAVNGDISADKLTVSLLKWLESNKKRRFFIWAHYFDTHSPYSPPGPYDTLYIADSFNNHDKNLPIDAKDNTWVSRNVIPYNVAANGITDVDYYISQYDGEIRFVDEQISLLLHKLKEMSLDRNTVVIITSDHGENLGEHGIYFQHGGVPYDNILLVPLIFKCDDLIPKSLKIEQQVSSVDIFPTILDILKIKYRSDIAGKSFLGLMQGKTKNHANYAFANSQNSVYSMRTKKRKLISLDDFREFYFFDIENDKAELNNIKDVRKEEFNIFSKELNKWVEENRSRVYPEGRSSLDKGALEKLQSLGYLQGGSGTVDQKIARPFSKLMDTYRGPTISVSGEVIFDNYKDGVISIFARTEDRTRPPDIAILTILKPGKYILKIPKDFGNIYMGAVNIKKGQDPEPGDPRDEYLNNPLKVGAVDISNVNIIIKSK